MRFIKLDERPATFFDYWKRKQNINISLNNVCGVFFKTETDKSGALVDVTSGSAVPVWLLLRTFYEHLIKPSGGRINVKTSISTQVLLSIN